MLIFHNFDDAIAWLQKARDRLRDSTVPLHVEVRVVSDDLSGVPVVDREALTQRLKEVCNQAHHPRQA